MLVPDGDDLCEAGQTVKGLTFEQAGAVVVVLDLKLLHQALHKVLDIECALLPGLEDDNIL